MKYKSQIWLSALLVTSACAHLLLAGLAADPPPPVYKGTAAPPASPAGAATAAPVAPANALDELTGPIALYPDPIVFQILTAAQNYDTIKLFSGWLEKNANLKGDELQNAAQKAGFSEALVALAPFPQVVKMMVEKPDWTKALGQAVTADKKAVGDSIQRLRTQAQAVGNLKTTPQQVVVVTNVIVEKTIEQQVVVVTNTIIQIQPANPQVIYVPTYNPTVVYYAPAPTATYVTGAAVVGFTAGVIVGSSWHNHYHYDYDDYWDDREDYYEDRQKNAQENQDKRQADQDQRQSDRQANQDGRQSGRQENQGQRASSTPAQSQGQANQTQRQTAAPSTQQQGASGQGQRPTAAPSAQPQPAAGQAQRQPASPSAQTQGGGGQTASRSSGKSYGGASSYQSGSATRSQSSRGSSSMSSSRSGGGRSGGGGGGGRGGGGRGR